MQAEKGHVSPIELKLGSNGLRLNRSPRLSRTWRVLALLATAATVAYFLPPSYWLGTESSDAKNFRFSDPADAFQDDVYPLRPHTPWDISTDYPFPRKLKYDVTEGTWLRLDVHPKTGDIVFDMLGDLYCLPAAEASTAAQGGDRVKARPVLLGVPHDTNPHFSPNGKLLAFSSDAGLGVENIWVTPWKGCVESDLRLTTWTKDNILSKELMKALSKQEEEEKILAASGREDWIGRRNRLLREGRSEARMVTNETFRWVADPRFHPDGTHVITSKWYTSSRSLGAGEGWTYDIPHITSSQKPGSIAAGSGKRLVSRALPPGWSASQYGDQQVGPEEFIWHGKDGVIFSKNTRDDGEFTYSKDVHKGIYAIYAKNLTTGVTQTLVKAAPGGASRPELSRDGRTLAFVRRVRDKEALVFKDLTTGTIHHIWYGLSYDLSVISAPMGTYPSFAFTPDDSTVIIWAAGKIWNVPLQINEHGERVAGGEPRPIEFTAHIEQQIAETRAGKTVDLVGLESAETARTYAFDGLKIDTHAQHVVYHSAGRTYHQKVKGGRGMSVHPTRIPHLHANAGYYAPTFVPNAEHLIVQARWSDVNFTSFEISDLESGKALEIAGLPYGRFTSLAVCACSGKQRTLAFIKTGGDILTGDTVATAQPGLYLASFTLPHGRGLDSKEENIELKDIRFIPSDVRGPSRLRFLEANKRLLVEDADTTFVIDLGAGPDKMGKYPHTTLTRGRTSSEIAHSTFKGKTMKSDYVAFVDYHHVYVAPTHKVNGTLWSRPGNATDGLIRLSLDGGHDLAFSGDGGTLFWFLGPYLHSLNLLELSLCKHHVERDQSTFGVKCTSTLSQYEEVVVKHTTDIERLRQETSPGPAILIITNATLLTMSTGTPDDVIRDGILFVQDGLITGVYGDEDDIVFPESAVVVDAKGAFITPGFIDVHAHWSGFDSAYPARSWELETFLAYGVTTLHNPSAENVHGFQERTRVENGLIIGPRIFTVGEIIYGADVPQLHHDIVDMDEAREALIQIKAEGGPMAFSYKNYQLPSRASRQRLLLKAKDMNMLCVPEGGMHWNMDLTFIADGMTTIEHALPVPQLYDDVLTFYALSGTGSTPTHVVNYGGAWGEQLVWGKFDIPSDPKLRQFTRHDILEGLSETTSRPFSSFQLFNTSASVAQMVQKGLKAHIGAHGEPPLGLNYHAEMFFTQKGGLTNYETIRAATSDAAVTLGLRDSIGALEVGLLADLVIYEPGVDLLEGDIEESVRIRYVVRGGRVYNAKDLTEVWPVKGRRPAMPPINAD